MKWLKLFQKPNPGYLLYSHGKRQEKARIRAKTDEMRKQLGMPPFKWGRLT